MKTKQLTLADVAGGIGMVGANVPKTMDGSKTQTRRVEKCLKDLPSFLSEATKTTLQGGVIGFAIEGEGAIFPVFPKYQPGKVYYVKEALEKKCHNGCSFASYKTDGEYSHVGNDRRKWQRDDGTPWKPNVIPARYMPKSAARTLIKIQYVKCERLHDIRDKDIIAEGVGCQRCDSPFDMSDPSILVCHKCKSAWPSPWLKTWFSELWDECNGKGAWELNPWVFAYEYKTVEVTR